MYRLRSVMVVLALMALRRVCMVYARIVLTLPGFIVIVGCTVCLVGVPFMFCLVLTVIGLTMSVRCTVGVHTRSYLHRGAFLVCVWCTVYVFGSLSCLYGVLLMFCLFVLPLLGVCHLCMAYSVHVVTV